MSMRRPNGSVVSTSNIRRPSKPVLLARKAATAVKAYANKSGLRQSPLKGARQAVSAFKAGRANKNK